MKTNANVHKNLDGLEYTVCPECEKRIKEWNLLKHLQKSHDLPKSEVSIIVSRVELSSVFDYLLDINSDRNRAGVIFIKTMIQSKSQSQKRTQRFVREYNSTPKRPAVKALGAYAVVCCAALSIDKEGIMHVQHKGVSMLWKYPEIWLAKDWDNPPAEIKDAMNVSKQQKR